MQNKIKLNITKTKVMIINDEYDGDIMLDGAKLEIIKEIKYLGLWIDDKLSFMIHVNYICKKISKKLFFFYKLRGKVSFNCAVRIFNVMIKPHFEYCSTLLAFLPNEQIGRLQKLQNRGMRIILKCSRYSSIKFMLDSLNWLNINQRLKMNILLFVFKMKNGLVPKYLSESLMYGHDVHHYQLRNIFNFRLDFFRTEGAKKTVMYNGLKMFNELPRDIKNINNIKHFKKSIISYVKEKF
jgi:hypothetical protein